MALTLPGLVAAYNFNEGAGATAADLSTTGNIGVVSGAEWAAGIYGSALTFDGQDDWVTIAGSSALDLTTGMTLEAWLNPTSLQGWQSALIKEGATDAPYALYANEADQHPAAWIATNSGAASATPTAALPADRWTHLAATYDASTLRVFVNSAQRASTAVSGPLITSAGALRIGGNSAWGEYFAGAIDDVRIYNRALTPAELEADMDTPIADVPSDATPPTVAITAPANGATLSGIVSTAATASDNATLVGVRFLIDGASLDNQDTSAPYGISWNTLGVPNGTHTITARARDAAGNATSTDISVNVSNATTGLVAAYAFDEGTGITTADATGNFNTGTLAGTTWSSSGKHGGAASFDGDGDWITVNASSGLDLTSAMTLEAWVRPTVLPTWSCVLFKEAPSTTSYSLYASDTETPSGTNGRPGAWVLDSTGLVPSLGSTGLPTDTWSHLAATYDSATLKFYLNGELAASATPSGPIVTSTGDLHIGGDSVWGEWFTGLIDDVRVYSRALTLEEIVLDMATPVGTGTIDCGSQTLDDGNPCTTDACDATNGVTHTPVAAGTSCADADACNGAETCDGSGTCTAGTTVVCVASDACHGAGTCNSSTGQCSNPVKPDGTACLDGNACNGTEMCQAGTCSAGTALTTDDNNPCTADSCDPLTGVVHTPIAAGASCADSDLCDGNELCDGNGGCLPGTPVPVDTTNPCQAGSCDPATGIVTYTPAALGSACVIDLCTDGTCDSNGECAASAGSPADDGDPCTVDTCDPQTGAKHRTCGKLDTGVAHNVFMQTEWLYTGTDPIQAGVTPGVMVPERVSGLRGKVTTRSGSAISGAVVTVLNHSEYGHTVTQVNGGFDLAVNGGGPLTLKVEKEGYLSVQREVATGWSQWRSLDDIVMIPPDPVVTAVDLVAPSSDFQVAQSSMQSDSSGTRSGTLLIPAGVGATMTHADGTTEPLDAMNVRITEFTVGPQGLAAMPAALPRQIAYTYAFEVNADEAVAAGARSIQFSQPLPYYVDNFLNFPAGTVVPYGTYDREAGVWECEESGIVLTIVSVTGGLASLDVTGDGVADGSAQLAPLGITDSERQTLATLYAAGRSLWRVRLRHFTSPMDCNWPWKLPPDADPPNNDPPKPPPTPDDPCRSAGGSVIECENQIFHEDIPLGGTPYALHYSSARVPGYRPLYHIDIPLTGTSVPASLARVELKIEIAGRVFRSTFPAAANQATAFDWDGLDAAGRTVQGSQKAIVTISNIYTVTYQTGTTFGDFGGGTSLGLARLEVPLDRTTEVPLGPYTASGIAIGGWVVDAHVGYDPTGRHVDFGDGQRQTSDGVPAVVRRLLQSTCGNCPPPADGSIPLADASGQFGFAGISIGARPDGSVYIAERRRIWRLNRDGRIFRIAGNGQESSPSGDGGPALSATLDVRSMAVAADGTVYIAEFNRKIRKITPAGTILPFAGTGAAGSTGDGGPASQATFVDQIVLAAAADGSVLVGEWQGNGSSGSRVRRINTCGEIQTVAGHGPGGSITFEVPATASYLLPQFIAPAPDGSFYVSHVEGGHSVIVRVDSDGVIHHVGGCVQGGCPSGDNLPAKQHNIVVNGLAADEHSRVLYTTTGVPSDFVRRIEPGGQLTRVAGHPTPSTYRDGAPALSVDPLMGAITVVPDGIVALSVNGGREVRKIQNAMPGISVGTLVIGRSADGALMTFDGNGKGLDIRHGLTGAPTLTFGYTASGLFDRLTDGSGLITQIERDSSGKPLAIVAPFGQRTSLELDTNGWLAAVVDPEGNRFEATHAPNGLLEIFTRPGDLVTEVTYDADGRVLTDMDASGATMTLARIPQSDDWDVTRTTALGHTTTYPVRYGALAKTQAPTTPSGETKTIASGTDKVTTVTEADGTSVTTRVAPDDRLGLMWPVTSRSTTVPSGLTSTEAVTRTYTDLSPTNLQSFSSFTDQKVVNGQTWRSVYTVNDRTFRTTTPASRTSLRSIDTLGRTTRTQLDSLAAVDYFYDSNGRIDHVTRGSGGLARTTQDTYFTSGAAAGYLSSNTDATSVATAFGRDALGRTVTETRAATITAFAWDALSNLIGVTPPGKPLHAQAYTPVNLLESYTPPPAGLTSYVTNYTYDADRMLRTESRPNGVQIVRTPDSAGRLDTVAVPGGLVDYDYYAPGTPTGAGKISDIHGPYGTTVHVTYDGNLTKTLTWSGDVAGSVAWNYNADFNKILETVSGATGTAQAAFGYDVDQLLTCASPTTCSPPGTDALTLTRNTAGFVSNIALGNTSETVTYNTFGELARQTATFAPSAPLVDITYDAAGVERDKLGRIVQKTEVIGGATKVYQYTYDTLRRLTDVTVDGTLEEHFEYDPNGNRTLGYNRTAGTTYTGTYDDQDRLLSYGPFDYTYTANGELETKTNRDNGDAWLFQYDALGNLLTVGLPNGDLVEYLVDGMGRRVGKKRNGVLLKQWIYRDALKPAAELDGSGALVSEFVYGSKGNVPDYVRRGGTTYRVISDHLGSPRYVVNVANASDVPFTATYTSFGEVTGTGLDWMPFGFAGGIYDADSGLVRFGARDYWSLAGRWLGKDPIRFSGPSVNLYVYTVGDPLNALDVDGRLPALPGPDVSQSISDFLRNNSPSSLFDEFLHWIWPPKPTPALVCSPGNPPPPPPPPDCGAARQQCARACVEEGVLEVDRDLGGNWGFERCIKICMEALGC